MAEQVPIDKASKRFEDLEKEIMKEGIKDYLRRIFALRDRMRKESEKVALSYPEGSEQRKMGLEVSKGWHTHKDGTDLFIVNTDPRWIVFEYGSTEFNVKPTHGFKRAIEDFEKETEELKKKQEIDEMMSHL